MPKGTVGHHLKVLERAGLVHVVRTRRVRAVTEKYYGRVARLFLYKSCDEQDDELLHGVGATSLRIAAAEVAAAPEVAMHALLRIRLDPAAVKRFNRRLESSRTTCGPPRRPTASAGASPSPSTGRSVTDAQVPARRPLAAPRLPQPLGGGDGQPARHADLAVRAAARRHHRAEASAFEVALLGVIEFLPFILISLPAGVWVDRLRAQADPRHRRPRTRAAARVDSGRALAGRADDLAALRRRLHGRLPHRLLRRLVPVVPALARRARPADRGQLEARDQPLGGAARGPGSAACSSRR